ncbi:MAG: hypothetical protein KatS3mg077_3344 [Candidatus Binatia bacterium]|nr:MAG: hypothetical protein KatS3mg077_3344 [Candidatus Binatia bacterium]
MSVFLRVNDLVQFSNDVDLRTGAVPRLYTQGDLLLPSKTRPVAVVRDATLAFDVMGIEGRLGPLPGSALFSDLPGFPFILGTRSVVIGADSVDLQAIAFVGSPGVSELARLEAVVRFGADDCPRLVRMRGLAGYVTPSISFVEIDGQYDCAASRFHGRVVCRFPFTDQPSFIGEFGVESCGFNRVDLTLGNIRGEGITITPPVVPVRLKAGRDLVVRLEHICDRDPFLIYVGTRATLCIDAGLECVSIRGEFFRVADLGLGYQHPYNFDIRGGTAQVLGFPVAGLRGRFQGNQPPIGMLLRGYATLAAFMEGSADLAFSLSRALVYGTIRGALQVPAFSCDPVNILCKAVRAGLTELAGPLPARFANATLTITARAAEDSWSGTGQAELNVGTWPLVVLVQLADEGATLQLGVNYSQMYSLDLGFSTRQGGPDNGTMGTPTSMSRAGH